MKPSRTCLVILWLVGVVTVFLALVPSQVMNYLTGLLTGTGSAPQLKPVLSVVLLFFLCLCAKAALDSAKIVLSGKCLEDAVHARSLEIYRTILRASPDFFRRNPTAQISNRIVNDTRRVESFKLQMKSGVPLAAAGVLAYTCILFVGFDMNLPLVGRHHQAGSPFLALLVLAFCSVQSLFFLFDRKVQKINKSMARAGDNVYNLSNETIAGVGEIRGNYAFDYALGRLRDGFSAYRDARMGAAKLRAVFTGLAPAFRALVNCSLLAIGARLCLGEFRVPLTNIAIPAIAWKDYFGFAGMALVMHGYFGSIIGFIFSWRMSRESIRRVNEYLSSPALFEKGDAPGVDGKTAAIRFEDIEVAGDTGSTILSDVSFRVKPGEHVALVGPSGCGKSVAMGLIVRGLAHRSGRLVIGDHSVADCDFESLVAEIGSVGQKPILFNTSLRENMLLGMRGSQGSEVDLDRRLLDAVARVGLNDDLIRMALDSPCPARFAGTSTIVEKAAFLRSSITAAVAEDEAESALLFDADNYMPACTMRENLLCGKTRADMRRAVPGDEVKASTRALYSGLKGDPFLQVLTGFGRWLCNWHRSAGELQNGEEPGQEALRPEQSKRRELVLIEAALSAEARRTNRYFARKPADLAGIAALRKKLGNSKAVRQLNVVGFDRPEPSAMFTIREILLSGRANPAVRNSTSRVDRIICRVLDEEGLIEELKLMGLEYRCGEEGKLLSGGQAMKVTIARAMMKDPKVLLLDEATGPLDEKSQADIVRMIREKFGGKTVITASHRLSTIRDYDTILVFDRGRIVQEGTYEQLAAREGLFRTLARQQGGVPESAPAAAGPSIGQGRGTANESVGSDELRRVIALSPIFSGLSGDQVALLEQASEEVTCPAGTVLFNRGDSGDEFFIIVSGEVEFFTGRDSGDEVIDTYREGQSFGELALLGNIPRTLGARARTDLRLCVVDREDLLSLVSASPQTALSLLETLSRRISSMRGELYR